MHCPNCKSSLRPGSIFCGQCGHAFGDKKKTGNLVLKKWTITSVVFLVVIGLISVLYILPYLATKGILPPYLDAV